MPMPLEILLRWKDVEWPQTLVAMSSSTISSGLARLSPTEERASAQPVAGDLQAKFSSHTLGVWLSHRGAGWDPAYGSRYLYHKAFGIWEKSLPNPINRTKLPFETTSLLTDSLAHVHASTKALCSGLTKHCLSPDEETGLFRFNNRVFQSLSSP